jgi:hypothetical protein
MDKSTPNCTRNAPRALFEALRRELEVNLPKIDQGRADPRDDIGAEPAVNSVPLAPDFAVQIALAGLSTGQPVINLGISDERATC